MATRVVALSVCLAVGFAAPAPTGTGNRTLLAPGREHKHHPPPGETPRQWFSHIIGGSLVRPGHKYEFLSQLVENGGSYASNSFCGGSLIAPNWVLTAAHCTEYLSGPSDISVLVNWHDLGNSQDPPGEVHRVEQIIDHPSYDYRTLSYDFSLLRLSSSSSREPIALDNGLFSIPGFEQTVAGWGSTNPDRGEYPNEAREVEVPIVSSQDCNARQSYNGEITSDMICAGYSQGGRDACGGDSGGPLFSLEVGTFKPHLTGVVSWGEGCAQPYKYGVYGRVSHVLPWINGYISTGANRSVV